MLKSNQILGFLATKFILAVLILLFCVSLSNAQVFNGIVDGPDGSLSGVTVINCMTKGLTLSNSSGEFKINAQKGDKIAFQRFDYVPDTIVVNDQKLLIAHLNKVAISLDEVLIRSAKLNPLEMYRKNQEDYKKIYRLGNMGNIISLNGAAGGAGIGFNIDAIYNAFSYQGRNARKLQRTLFTDYQDNVVDSRFTPSLVSEISGFKGKELSDFIINNRPTYEFVANASDYDIIDYIKRRVKGVVMATDNPMPAKPKKEGFQIKYKPPGQASNGPIRASYIPIRP